MTFLETVMAEYDQMRARAFAGDGYEGVTHAGIALVDANTGLVLMCQRAYDPTDAPDVAETWEFPGGGLDEGEEPLAGALREFSEELGLPVPEDYEVVNGWRSKDEVYQGFVCVTHAGLDLSGWVRTEEVQAAAWVPARANRDMVLRPEMRDFDWSLLDVSGNEEATVAALNEDDGHAVDVEPDLTAFDLMTGPIPVHGVLAPEETESGDSRGFAAGAVTSRPYRLPFMWQKNQTSGHDGAGLVGSVDRLMRKDGLIHWEGALMPTAEANDFAEVLAFFGRFGVSVDGDRGSLDDTRTRASGVMWFDAVRAAGLTAVSIPAFAEAYVAFGPHPDMPEADSEEFAVLTASGSAVTFDRGPGWVTNPKETKRIHDYWMPGHPGGDKIAWGTPGDFTRAKKLIGEKIGLNSPEDLRYLNQIIAQWHHDALGYWPGDWDKPGNDTTAEGRAKRKARAAASLNDGWAPVMTAAGWCDVAEALFLEGVEEGRITEVGLREDGAILWALDGEFDLPSPEALTASAVARTVPPLDYFHRPDGEFSALTIMEPDENGLRRTFGYAAQWGVCHIGMAGQCVEPPRTWSNDYPEFHLGRTRVGTDDGSGYVNTGVLTYGVGHRDAQTILSESAEQAYFDNVKHAWAAVRVGEDETGIWFSGYVLPHVSEEDIVLIEASGQVSGEWLRGEMRACLTVNVPGFAVERPSVEYDEDGNVLALAASAFGMSDGQVAPCEPTPAERMAALAQACEQADAESRMAALKDQYVSGNSVVESGEI